MDNSIEMFLFLLGLCGVAIGLYKLSEHIDKKGLSKLEILKRCNTMPHEVFNRFIVGIQRVAWILTQMRLIKRHSRRRFRDFLSMARFPTWWWALLFHPFKVLKAFRDNILTVKSA